MKETLRLCSFGSCIKKYLVVRNKIPKFDHRSLSSEEQIPLVSPEVNKQRHQRLLHQHSGHLAQGGSVLAAGQVNLYYVKLKSKSKSRSLYTPRRDLGLSLKSHGPTPHQILFSKQLPGLSADLSSVLSTAHCCLAQPGNG